MRTPTNAVCGTQPITAPTSNFLRVNAQMRNLTKQKTVSSCKPLGVIYDKTHYNNIIDTPVLSS